MDTSVLAKKTVICRHCGSTNTFLESDGVGSQQRYEVVCLCGWRADLRTGLPGDASNWIDLPFRAEGSLIPQQAFNN